MLMRRRTSELLDVAKSSNRGHTMNFEVTFQHMLSRTLKRRAFGTYKRSRAWSRMLGTGFIIVVALFALLQIQNGLGLLEDDVYHCVLGNETLEYSMIDVVRNVTIPWNATCSLSLAEVAGKEYRRTLLTGTIVYWLFSMLLATLIVAPLLPEVLRVWIWLSAILSGVLLLFTG